MTDITIPANVAKREAAYLRDTSEALRRLNEYPGMAQRLDALADLLDTIDPPPLSLKDSRLAQSIFKEES